MTDFVNNECHDRNEDEEDLAAPEFAVIVACGKQSVFCEERADQHKCRPCGGNDNGFVEADGVQKLKTTVGKHKKQEAEHEAVTVVQPVGFLEAVHHKVKRRNAHDEVECTEDESGTDLLSYRNTS